MPIRRRAGQSRWSMPPRAAVYGDAATVPIAETEACAPLSAYGADKYGCELHARVASHVHGIPAVGLRFFNVYGPRQDPRSPYSGVISIFCERIAGWPADRHLRRWQPDPRLRLCPAMSSARCWLPWRLRPPRRAGLQRLHGSCDLGRGAGPPDRGVDRRDPRHPRPAAARRGDPALAGRAHIGEQQPWHRLAGTPAHRTCDGAGLDGGPGQPAGL